MFKELENTYAKFQDTSAISEERIALLDSIADYLKKLIDKQEPIKLNFICTENSRRSHLSQLLSAAIIDKLGLPIETYSGGTKVSACNPRTIAALRRAGFRIENGEGENPKYKVVFEPNDEPIFAYSKLYNAPENPQDSFIAIMVCGHADENCPFIPNAEKRFAVTFDDPKVADDTPEETATYDERLHEIGSQFYYLFNQVKNG